MNVELMHSLTGWCSNLPLAAESGTSVSLFRFFVIEGGPITWFVQIPLCMTTVALIVHYLIVIRRGTLVPTSLVRSLRTAFHQRQVGPMVQALAGDETMLGQATQAAFARLSAGREAARAAIDETVEEWAMRLMRRIEYLNVIGNVSPMIGLFGTVVGMIMAFVEIAKRGGGMPAADKLAGDIGIALVTTLWGLGIAIPALSAFALFRNRIDTYAAEVIQFCDGLLAAGTRDTASPLPLSSGEG
jgi:biopolymer transport protein ExbB